jgi:phage terminase large subunit
LNEKNLIPNSQRTPEELREMTRKGGIRSGEVRRRKKTMREMVKLIGSSPADAKQKAQLKALLGDRIEDEEITYTMLVAMTLYQKALKEKNMQAIEKIFEIDGLFEEKDTSYQDLSVDELRGLLNGNQSKSTDNPKT